MQQGARLHLVALDSSLQGGVSPDTRRAITALIGRTELALTRRTTLAAHNARLLAAVAQHSGGTIG
jgi:hypothetical protein